MKINMPMTITAADSDSRTITGRVVTWNEAGFTNAGKTIFAQDSIALKPVKLFLEHENTKPIGRVLEFNHVDDGAGKPLGIDATFKIAKTYLGDAALEEAALGLRDGFSVGIKLNEWKEEDGAFRVLSSNLVEVSLVESPAIDSARVSEVAASEENPEKETEMTEATKTTEPEATVEASKEEPKLNTSYPLNSQTVRNPIISASSYLEHTLKAALGNHDSALYVKAADDSFTTNPAFDKVSYLDRVIDTSTKFGRPTIDAFGGTTATKFIGTTVSVPKITGNSTVTVEAEEGATSETGITSAYVTGTVNKYAGMQTFSQEILDLQGTPVFYDTMLKNLYAAYAKATNEAVIAECVSGGTQAATQAATAAGLIAFHANETAAAYLATGDFASAYIAGSSQWVLAMGSVDTTGRPIFNAGMPANSGGSIGGTSARGKFLDLDFYADRSMVATTIDDSAFIIVPSAMLLLEQAPQKLQVAVLGSGQYEVSFHGYLLAKTLIAGGIRRFNIA